MANITNLTVRSVNAKEDYSIVRFETDMVDVKTIVGTSSDTKTFFLKTNDDFAVGQVLEDIDIDKLKVTEDEYVKVVDGVGIKQTSTWIIG